MSLGNASEPKSGMKTTWKHRKIEGATKSIFDNTHQMLSMMASSGVANLGLVYLVVLFAFRDQWRTLRC